MIRMRLKSKQIEPVMWH